MNQKTKSINKKESFAGHSIRWVFILFAVSVYGVSVKTTHAQSGHVQTVIKIPQTLKPLDSHEVFGPDNLYEKINGQAELYLSAGFVRLKSQWFAEVKNLDSMFEVYIYRMEDGLSAFSVYSSQRRNDAQKVKLSPFAYQTVNSFHLLHGPYYVEMISAKPSERVLPIMTSLAQNFINDTPVDSKSTHGFGFFPKENLLPGSISLIAKNAFGFSGLDRVFTAAYKIHGIKVTAFVSKRKTPQEAKNLAHGLYKYFITFGGKDINPEVAIEEIKMIEIMDTFDIVFSLNSYLAGVHEASTKKQAEELAEKLAKTLQE